MATLNELANTAKRELVAGDNSAAAAEKHYALAGKALLVAKKRVGHGNWLEWLAKHQIGKRRAQEVMEIAEMKKTVKQMRDRVKEAKARSRTRIQNKSASRDARSKDGFNPCDYDWDNVKEADFGNPSRAYKAQAEHYRREAIHLATAYPLLNDKVDLYVITDKEIRAAQEVARAWSDVVIALTARRKIKEKEKEKETICA
jgi:hypothetical protein